jgi:hypothetical protein
VTRFAYLAARQETKPDTVAPVFALHRLRAVVLGSVLLAVLVPAALAGPPPPPWRVKRGETLAVAGTALACLVDSLGGANTLNCFKPWPGTSGPPKAGVYLVSMSDAGVGVGRVLPGGHFRRLVYEPQPPIASRAFIAKLSVPLPGRMGAISPTRPIYVDGTHIFCSVERVGGHSRLFCGEVDQRGTADRSYGLIMGDHLIQLVYSAHSKLQGVVYSLATP